MPLIVFPSKELQASSLYCGMLQANGTPGNAAEDTRNISENDRELENLLRIPFGSAMRKFEPLEPRPMQQAE